MTKTEMTEIFSIMMLAWPNHRMFDPGTLKQTVELWAACLSDIDFDLGRQAVIRLCRECKFPPSIAEFREQAAAEIADRAERLELAEQEAKVRAYFMGLEGEQYEKEKLALPDSDSDHRASGSGRGRMLFPNRTDSD